MDTSNIYAQLVSLEAPNDEIRAAIAYAQSISQEPAVVPERLAEALDFAIRCAIEGDAIEVCDELVKILNLIPRPDYVCQDFPLTLQDPHNPIEVYVILDNHKHLARGKYYYAAAICDAKTDNTLRWVFRPAVQDAIDTATLLVAENPGYLLTVPSLMCLTGNELRDFSQWDASEIVWHRQTD